MPNAVFMSVSRISIYMLLLLDIYTITSHTIWNVYLYIKKIHIYSIYISSFFLSSFRQQYLFKNRMDTPLSNTGIAILYYGHIGASHHQQVSQVRNTKPPQTNVALSSSYKNEV